MLGILVVVLLALYFPIRPGVFTVQPIGVCLMA